MKKTLIALAVLGATSSFAMAASNITLYGKVSEGVIATKIKGEDATTQMKSGFDAGSRWGIKGVEDLGNGYKVGFVLEQGFNADDGTASSTRQFHRESQLYVAGDFGKVGVGRFGSLSSGTGSYSILCGWALGTSYTSGSFNNYDGTLRVDNGIVYVSPAMGGFTVHAMYSNGLAGDTAKWSENNHYYGLGVKYQEAAIKSSLILEANDGKGTGTDAVTAGSVITQNQFVALGLGDKDAYKDWAKTEITAATADKEAAYAVNFGFEYNLGEVTPMFAYRYQTQDDVAESHTFGLSAKAAVAGGTAKVGVRYRIEKLDGTAKQKAVTDGKDDDGSVWAINAAYEYKLSKRTTLWSYGGYADGSDMLAKASKADVNYNGWQLGVGLTHNF